MNIALNSQVLYTSATDSPKEAGINHTIFGYNIAVDTTDNVTVTVKATGIAVRISRGRIGNIWHANRRPRQGTHIDVRHNLSVNTARGVYIIERFIGFGIYNGFTEKNLVAVNIVRKPQKLTGVIYLVQRKAIFPDTVLDCWLIVVTVLTYALGTVLMLADYTANRTGSLAPYVIGSGSTDKAANSTSILCIEAVCSIGATNETAAIANETCPTLVSAVQTADDAGTLIPCVLSSGAADKSTSGAGMRCIKTVRRINAADKAAVITDGVRPVFMCADQTAHHTGILIPYMGNRDAAGKPAAAARTLRLDTGMGARSAAADAAVILVISRMVAPRL